ncbi:MAG: hypothetical protein ACYC3S_03405 [Chloroflexota bacterium]
MFRWLAISLAIVALLIGGCTSPAQKVVEQTTGTSINQKGDTVTIKGKDGEQFTLSSTMPDELKNFPAPAGFKLENASSISAGADKTATATWKGKAPITDVAAFYKKYAADQNWQVGLTFGDATSGQIHGTAPDNMNYIVSYSLGSDGGTEITVMASKVKATPTKEPATATTVAVAKAAATSTKPQTTPAPEAPATTTQESLPNEIKDIPLPSGFALEKDGAFRLASGNNVSVNATFYGTGDMAKIQAFFESQMVSKGWEKDTVLAIGDQVTMMFTQQKNNLDLSIGISVVKKDPGLEIIMMYSSEQS